MTLLELLATLGERDAINVCVRTQKIGGDTVSFFCESIVPILRKHNVQAQFTSNVNGLNGVWITLNNYVLSKPSHGIYNWGAQYEALREIASIANVKIGFKEYNYVLDENLTITEKVQVMEDC